MSQAITSENVRAYMVKVEREAGELFAKAEQMKADMAAEGVNPLADKDAFEKLDEAYKAYSTKVDEAAQCKEKLAQLEGFDGMRRGTGGPGTRTALGGGEMGVSRPGKIQPIGSRFVNSDAYRGMHDAGVFTTEASFKSAMLRGFDKPIELLSRDEIFAALQYAGQFQATTVTGGGATSAGPFVIQDLQPGFVPYIRKRPLLASLVGQGTTDSDVVEYVTQSAPTDSAREEAEDAQAQESTYAFATNDANVREIAHFVPVTLRAMADYGQIRTIIENQLVAGVLDRLDTQLASGNGSGQNLTGIYNASIGTQALGGDNRADAIHKAMTVVRVAAGVLSDCDWCGMHPNDAQSLRLEQDADGNYLFGPPSMGGPMQVWGCPVAMSTVFTSGTPLVGDFAGSATLWLREALSVTTGLDGNDFTKRRVSILAAIRIAFAVTRAGGFCQVTGF